MISRMKSSCRAGASVVMAGESTWLAVGGSRLADLAPLIRPSGTFSPRGGEKETRHRESLAPRSGERVAEGRVRGRQRSAVNRPPPTHFHFQGSFGAVSALTSNVS